MVSITQLAHDIVRSTLVPGEFAIDATAGNGHDTLFLARQVGPVGRVWAFDIQQVALESTHSRLASDQISHVELILASHAEMKQLVPPEVWGNVAAVMFNLGYLPFQDHRLTTILQSTLLAVQQSLDALRPGGALTVIAYRGHPGGDEEACAVEDWMWQLPEDQYARFRFPETRPQRGPQLLSVKKINR